MTLTYKHINPSEIFTFRELMKLFGEVFDELDTYQGVKPDEAYIKDFLNDKKHIVLIAQDKNVVIGGLVAYELKKFERERSEIYIYDLAVSKQYQRKGVATTLIEKLKDIAKERGISSLFVQADKADKKAVSFYNSLHIKQTDTYTFDIKM